MFLLSFSTALSLLLALQFQPSAQAPLTSPVPRNNGHYPTRVIAGVSVIDTPIVRAAQKLARQHSSDVVYKHVMRSWLFGTLLNGQTANSTLDVEAHAVAALLHDLGWDQTPNSPFVSPDKRFEVDGAISARTFIEEYGKGKEWDHHRVQLVWDAIALHTQPSLFDFKEPEVKVTGRGIQVEFIGVVPGITQEAYDGVIAEFPNDDFTSGASDSLVWLCQTKPNTTYDTALQPFGERFVPGYNATGHRVIDIVYPPA